MSFEETTIASAQKEKYKKMITSSSMVTQELEHVVNSPDNNNNCSKNNQIDEKHFKNNSCSNSEEQEKKISTSSSIDMESEGAASKSSSELQQKCNLEEGEGIENENEETSKNSCSEEIDANGTIINNRGTQSSQIDEQEMTIEKEEQRTIIHATRSEGKNNDIENFVCVNDVLHNDNGSVKVESTDRINSSKNIGNDHCPKNDKDNSMNFKKYNSGETDDTVEDEKLSFLKKKGKVGFNNCVHVYSLGSTQNNTSKKISFKPPPPLSGPAMNLNSKEMQNKQITNATCDDATKSSIGISFPQHSFKHSTRNGDNNITNSIVENSCSNRERVESAELTMIKQEENGKNNNNDSIGVASTIVERSDNAWLQAFSTEEFCNVNDNSYLWNWEYNNWLEERRKAYLTLNEELKSKESKHTELCNSERINKYINFADGLIANFNEIATTKSTESSDCDSERQEETNIADKQLELKSETSIIVPHANTNEQRSLVLYDSTDSRKLVTDAVNANGESSTKVDYADYSDIKVNSENGKHCMQSSSNINIEDWAASGAPLLSEENALQSLRTVLFTHNDTMSNNCSDNASMEAIAGYLEEKKEHTCQNSTLESLSSSTVASYMLDLHSVWQLQLKANKKTHENGHETLEDVLKKMELLQVEKNPATITNLLTK